MTTIRFLSLQDDEPASTAGQGTAHQHEPGSHLSSVERERIRSRVAPEFLDRTVLSARISDAAKEQYRYVATSLHQAQGARGIRTVLVASSVPSEGKTLTSVNLALTLAESFDKRVLLIDGDLRRPSLNRVFDVAQSSGLLETLVGTLPAHTIELSPHLTVLPAGAATNDPMAVLSSARMEQLIGEAKTLFDWVLVDSPPIGLLSDASLLTSLVDGVLVVVAAGRTPFDLVEKAVASLGRDRILGVILNRAEERNVMGGYGYYNYYGYYRHYYSSSTSTKD